MGPFGRSSASSEGREGDEIAFTVRSEGNEDGC